MQSMKQYLQQTLLRQTLVQIHCSETIWCDKPNLVHQVIPFSSTLKCFKCIFHLTSSVTRRVMLAASLLVGRFIHDQTLRASKFCL